MIALFELFLRLTCIYDIRRKMQIYGAHETNHPSSNRQISLQAVHDWGMLFVSH